MVAWPDRLSLTADEYLTWELTQEERYEFWASRVVLKPSSSKRHNRICGNCVKQFDSSGHEVYGVGVKV
jgi:hypothetical protein